MNDKIPPTCLMCLVLAAFMTGQQESVLTFNLASGGFDTGIAVSNIGADEGSITFKLFPPSEGEPREVVVRSADLAASSVGAGLEPDGDLPAGGTLTVLLSELASTAGIGDYAGQLLIETEFEQARAVNFVFNNALGSAHGYQAQSVAGRSGSVIQTFWGRPDCPAVDGFDSVRILQGVTYAGAGSSGGGVGGFLCGPDPITGEDIVNEGVLLRRVTTLQGSIRVDCAVCLMTAKP